MLRLSPDPGSHHLNWTNAWMLYDKAIRGKGGDERSTDRRYSCVGGVETVVLAGDGQSP
jgi:hypothetical protein